jgi:hypothetical protein
VEEHEAFLGAESMGPLAVRVRQPVSVEDKGVFGQDGLGTFGADPHLPFHSVTSAAGR